jgi:hypothetical protein
VNSKGFKFPFTESPLIFSELPDFLVLRDLKSRAERESDVGSADKYLYNDFIDP